MTRILLLGAGGAAGRNFRKAVDLGFKQRNMEMPFWGLIDSDKYALMLTHGGYSNAFISNKSFGEAIVSWDHDVVHSQPEEGVRLLCNAYDPNSIRYSINEYTFYRDKLASQAMWVKRLNIPFWVKDLRSVNKKKFNKMITRQPSGRLWMRAREGAGSRAALPVNKWDQVLGWQSYWESKDPNIRFILSDILPGPEYAVQMFWIEGELYISQARQRIDYLFGKQMPSGQSSTPSVSMSINTKYVYDVAEQAVKVLTNKPHGIYGVDIKTMSNGLLMPTEVNYGRFYTTSHQYTDYKPDPLNIPFDYVNYIANGVLPKKRINSLPSGIMHIRGLDSEGVTKW